MPSRAALRQGTVEIRLRLTTALGLNQHPASVSGYGTVRASDALAIETSAHPRRRVAHRDHRPPRSPQTESCSPAADPTNLPGPAAGIGRGDAGPPIVELQVPTTLLAALDPDDHPDWAPLLRELQQRLTDLGRPGAPPDHNAGPEDRARRRPGAELDRWNPGP